MHAMRQNGNRDGRYEEQIMSGTECNRLYGWPDARELFIVWRLHRRCGRLRTNREDDIRRAFYRQIHRRRARRDRITSCSSRSVVAGIRPAADSTAV